MKILVLSDSHSALRFMRSCVDAVKPDAIIHLGDYYDDAEALAEDYPNIRIWQWGSEAVDGIAGKVDANFMIAEKEEKCDDNHDIMNNQEDEDMAQERKPAAWAAEAVAWAQESGILLGDENGNLMLDAPVTREQMCVFLRRVYDRAAADAAGAVAARLMDALGGGVDGSD